MAKKTNLSKEVFSQSVNSFQEENKILAPLLKEIHLIEDQGIQLFVRAILLKADGFWVIPSSWEDDSRPPDESEVAGNVLHTQRVVRVIQLLCESQERNQIQTDMLLAAALLHDVTKAVRWYVDTDEYDHDPFHAYTVDGFVYGILESEKIESADHRSNTLMIDQDTMNQILRLIRCHHGPWAPIPETIPLSNMEWTLHIANYIASRVHWICDGDHD